MTALFAVAALITGAVGAVTSPDGRASYQLALKDGRASFSVSYDRKEVAIVSTGDLWRKLVRRGQAERHVGGWQTVWGDRATVKDAYVEEIYDATDAAGRPVVVEARVYDEGFAFRCRLPDGGVFDENTSVDYPADARAWAIEETEATYPERPIPLSSAGAREWMTPLTVESSSGYSSFFDAYAVSYPRIRVAPRKGGVAVKLLQKGAPVLKPNAATPWRVLQLAATAAELVDHSSLVLNLNPPCAIGDTSWIRPGLALSNLSNCRLNNAELIAAMKAEKKSNPKYLQLDWGWYGTEWGWSDADRAKFVERNPSMRDEPTWRGNTTGNARRSVKGIVPYLPGWQRQFEVDLDFPTLVPALADLGIGLCLYVRGPVLEKENLDELFTLYRKWGVAGVKPGFVRYGSAADTDWIRSVVEAAARHRLWVDIHDADIPDGRERTYPNLFLTEGVGGEEGKHPVRQDVTIPFARGLVGPFDYAPMVFTAGRSHAHVLAMLLCYPGPTAVLRGSSVSRDALSVKDSSWGWGDERDFVKALPWKYDESKTVDAEIGRKIVTVRRAGREWFAAGMCGARAETTKLKCGFLTPGVEYRMTLWTDDFRDVETQCMRTCKDVRTVTADDIVGIAMAPSGGFMAHFEELRPQRDSADLPSGRSRLAEKPFCVTGDRKTANDAWYLYKCNRNPEPELHIVGERETVTKSAKRTVVVYSNAMEVMFLLNGTFYGAQVPDRAKTCIWRDMPLLEGENRLEFRAGPITKRLTLRFEPPSCPSLDAAAFATPARDHFPETWFHLIGGNVAKEGLAADLEAIRESGISGIHFFHGGRYGGVWPGMENRQTLCLSEKWEELVKYIATTCKEKGLSFKMQNCPGWSMSGGPWIKPENAMRNLTYSRADVKGGGTVRLKLAIPNLPKMEVPISEADRDYRDLFVLAFPTPKDDTGKPLVPQSVSDKRLAEAFGGKKVVFEAGENPSATITFAKPVTVRSVEFPSERLLNHPYAYEPDVAIRLEARTAEGWRIVADEEVPPGSWQDNVAETLAASEARSDTWRISFRNAHQLTLPFLRLHSGARLNNWEGLAGWTLRALVRNVAPRQEAYAWVDSKRILDLTDKFRDGELAWEAPEGNWTVLRIGHVNNGTRNGPAPEEATGWECNKMDRSGVDCNYANYIGRLANGPLKGLVKGMVIDSWECRRQTWTAKMEEEFRARAGYDLRKKIPALFGWVIDAPDRTEAFLRDWRGVTGSLIEENYYRRLVELGHRDGLEVQYETAFGDVVPGDLMRYWRWADTPMCEFWQPHDNPLGNVGSYNFKPVYPCVSAAHLYGKRRVAAEAFTTMRLDWDETFSRIKDVANRHYARGVTHFVFHTYTHNPRTDWKKPGTSFGHCIGTPFIRGQTWWRYMPELTTYFARCETMLESGRSAVDVLRYLGDGLGHRPFEDRVQLDNAGYKVDYANPEILMTRLAVKNGKLMTPEGLVYSILWLPDGVYLNEKSQARLAELESQGAKIHRGGSEDDVGGLVSALRGQGIASDVRLDKPYVSKRNGDYGILWYHCRDARHDWYFVASEIRDGWKGTVSFRATGRAEIWDPLTGERRPAEVVSVSRGRTEIAMSLEMAESCFVVFDGDASSYCGRSRDAARPSHERCVVPGPWRLTFPGEYGEVKSRKLDNLVSWTTFPEPESAAFSGTGTYETTFAAPKSCGGGRVFLDLGEVESIADVWLNGQRVRTLWSRPYRCDVTGFLREGENRLRVHVTNTWFNRLAYDESLPEAGRRTWSIFKPKAGTPLRPSGLLGPVTLNLTEKCDK